MSSKLALALTFALTLVAISVDTADAGCRRGYRIRRYAPVIHHHHRVVHKPAVAAIVPPPPAANLTEIPAGSVITLPGNFLGIAPGHVFLVIDTVKLPCEIKDWKPNGVTLCLPPMAIKVPRPARLDVVLPHGKVGNAVKILMTPPAQVVLHPSLPQSPLPTGFEGPQFGAPVVNTPIAQ